MQEAIPYKIWLPIPLKTPINLSPPSLSLPLNHIETKRENGNGVVNGSKDDVKNMGLGVNPAVYEVDEEDEVGVVGELEMIGAGDGKDGRLQFPAVFIGGRLFGGLDRIMATHISGELIPVLKQAGALWL
ncbi:hypothetical protein F0562_010731 [Nyssa sinensis]|uniref:Uncharacterized protein n=1 Tax=Nyssa sinensis TaxID=561372 RepID=A0A5J5A2T5_9ASTE|nr:hypothetical protein F0562_010731 [Nyssa sinensis]